MDKINSLFDKLTQRHRNIFEIVQNIEPSFGENNWELLFDDAKKMILEKYNSSEIDKNTFLYYLKDKVVTVNELIRQHSYKIKELNIDEDLGLCLNHWDKFVQWFQIDILKQDISELERCSVYSDNGGIRTFNLEPVCQKKCMKEFIMSSCDLCDLCPVIQSNMTCLDLTKEQFLFSGNKKDFLDKELLKADEKIQSLLVNKKPNTIQFNWNKLFLSWIEIKEFCIDELEKLKANKEEIDNLSQDLPEIDLSTQKEQIRLLYDLGVIEYLQEKYPATLKGNNSQMAHLISQILKLKRDTTNSIQPNINALLNNNYGDKYPKETTKTRSIIDTLDSNELK